MRRLSVCLGRQRGRPRQSRRTRAAREARRELADRRRCLFIGEFLRVYTELSVVDLRVVRWKRPVNAGKLARFGSNLAPSRRRAQRLGSLFAELHCGLSLASTSAGTERAGWHLHLH